MFLDALTNLAHRYSLTVSCCASANLKASFPAKLVTFTLVSSANLFHIFLKKWFISFLLSAIASSRLASKANRLVAKLAVDKAGKGVSPSSAAGSSKSLATSLGGIYTISVVKKVATSAFFSPVSFFQSSSKASQLASSVAVASVVVSVVVVCVFNTFKIHSMLTFCFTNSVSYQTFVLARVY